MVGQDDDAHRRLRAADEDRHAVAEIIRVAAGEGRLSMEELDERLESAYAARTYADLESLVDDLPGAVLPWATATAATTPARRQDPTLRLTAGGSNQVRRGRWDVPSRLVLEPHVSNIVLDFREATCPHRVVEVEVAGGVGNVTLVVPEDWSVDVDRLRSSWGTVRNKRHGSPAPGKPTLVVSGGIGMGTFRARGALFYERWAEDQ